jgi:hypothetical protein
MDSILSIFEAKNNEDGAFTVTQPLVDFLADKLKNECLPAT